MKRERRLLKFIILAGCMAAFLLLIIISLLSLLTIHLYRENVKASAENGELKAALETAAGDTRAAGEPENAGEKTDLTTGAKTADTAAAEDEKVPGSAATVSDKEKPGDPGSSTNKETPGNSDKSPEKQTPGDSGSSPDKKRPGASDTVSENRTEQLSSNQVSHEQASGNQISQNQAFRKRVYLTFDDGPSVYTGRILDILASHDVKGTFFVCGTAATAPGLYPLYKRITDEGHTIGMHTYSHVYSEVYGSLSLFQDDLDKIRNLIYNETGVVPKYYRFPGGSSKNVAPIDMQEYIDILYSSGLEYVDWNVYAGDASGHRISSAQITENVLRGVDRNRDSVVLLHDTGDKITTVNALDTILSGLESRGVLILPFDEDAPACHQYISEKERS